MDWSHSSQAGKKGAAISADAGHDEAVKRGVCVFVRCCINILHDNITASMSLILA